MRKSIIGILICISIATTSMGSIAKTNADETKIQNLEEDISIELYQAPIFLGINLDIENKGAVALNDVEWSFRSKAAITGTGIFINEKLQTGTIEQINPGEKITLEFRPLKSDTRSPIGLGNMYINASVEADEIRVRTQQRSVILGIFLFKFEDTYMDIKPPEAYERWQDNEFDLIIDVVGLDIYSLGHLPGAVNYVWADGTLNSQIPQLDPELTYLVYCHTDPPSTASAQAMVNAEFEHIYRLEGNFKAWKDAGYPVEV